MYAISLELSVMNIESQTHRFVCGVWWQQIPTDKILMSIDNFCGHDTQAESFIEGFITIQWWDLCSVLVLIHGTSLLSVLTGVVSIL